MERGMEGGRRRPLNVSDYGYAQRAFVESWARRRVDKTLGSNRFLQDFRSIFLRKSKAVLDAPVVEEKKGEDNKFVETVLDLGGKPSSLKDDLLEIRSFYLRDCLQSGQTEWANSIAQKNSLFELLRIFSGILVSSPFYSERLSLKLKRVLFLLKNEAITICEDEYCPGQISLGISLSGAHDEVNYDPEIFTFLMDEDFFGRSIKTLSVSIGLPHKSSDKVVETLSKIQALKGVKGLSWVNTAISETGINLLLKTFDSSLQRLDLRRTWPTDEAVKSLTRKKEAGKHLVGLTHLDLSMNALNTDCLAGLFANNIVPNLSSLSLAQNFLDKKVKKSLAGSSLEKLKRLNLRRCKFTDEDVSELMNKAEMPNLQELFLDGNGISDLGVDAISSFGFRFPNLRRITLVNNPVNRFPIFSEFPSLEIGDLRNTSILLNHEEFDEPTKERLRNLRYVIYLNKSQLYDGTFSFLEREGLLGTVFVISE